jgi:hypothetical protein
MITENSFVVTVISPETGVHVHAEWEVGEYDENGNPTNDIESLAVTALADLINHVGHGNVKAFIRYVNA